MNSQNNPETTSGAAAWARRAQTVAAVLGLGLTTALGVFAAPQANSPTVATPYSWPGFHAGGTSDPTVIANPTPDGNPALAPYRQLQGTPSGIYTPAGGTSSYATQIPSTILGNYSPGQPPQGLTLTTPPQVAYFPNHFADGPTFSPHYRQVTGPLGFLAPPAGSGTADVQSSPTAVNVTEYPDIANMRYFGEQTQNTSGATSGGADPTRRGGAGATGVQAIRQVVFYGRKEAVTVLSNGTAGGVPVPAGIPAGSVIDVGAIYAMDGLTGGVIWRYQVPSFSAGSVVSQASRFTANLTGTANFNATVIPNTFQIGPTANITATTPEGTNPSPTGTGGAFVIGPTSPVPAGVPSRNLSFSLYATTATTTTTVDTAGNPTTATNYTGTFRIFEQTATINATNSADDGNILEHGNFTLTVDAAGAVTGQFIADTGALQPAYATGPVDFAPIFPAQVVTGTFSGGTLNLNIATPLGGTLQDASVFASVAVSKISVVTTAGAAPVSKLVVIAADNNGFVYCLDAVGTGDGTSNLNVYKAGTTPQQIAYTTGDASTLGVSGHVGTTTPYWIYRPDPAVPHLTSGAVDPAPNAAHNLPVPLAFNGASPTVYVDPTVTPAGSPNATVYIGNSNGVLYALDATGGVDPTAAAYNAARTGLPGVPDPTPTCNPKWWYAVSGTNADTGNDTTAIESAPAVYAAPPTPPAAGGGPVTGGGGAAAPTVYFGTSDSTGNNIGRLYAVNGTTGPTGPGGVAVPVGTANYNVNQQGQWTFPSSFAGPTSPTPFRNPLGDVSGSPVVFLADGATPVIYFAANTGDEFLNGAVVPASADTGRLWGVNLDGSYHFSYPDSGDPNAAANLSAANNNDFIPTGNTPPMEGFLHSTPAIGFVQFPTGTRYLDAGGASQPYTVAPQPTPMLYIGTTGANGGFFYGVNIDPNASSTSATVTTAGNDVIRVPCPNGASFVSSPALVTNPSNAGGNGGAVFICTSAGQLLQYQATPTSTASPAAPFPSPRLDYTFPAGGPISAPAVAAATISDFLTLTNTTNGGSPVTDYVYVGDSNTGQCWGFTPRGFGTDTTGDYFPFIGPVTPPNLDLPPIINQFPLRAFLFDDPNNPGPGSTHTGNLTSMDSAFGYGIYGSAANHSPLPAFEWGQSVSVRIANVVPPGTPVLAQNNYILINADDGTGTGGTTQYYLGNGGPVQFQVADVSTAGTAVPNAANGVSLTIPNNVITTPSAANPNPAQSDGFFRRSDYGSGTTGFGNTSELTTPTGTAVPNPTDYRAKETELLDPTGHGWAAAGTYSIGANTPQDAQGRNHPNTPGSRRQIISATQTYTIYALDANGILQPIKPKPTPTTTTANAVQNQLTLTANPAFSYNLGGGSYPSSTPAQTQQGSGTIVVDQPTFGILNPLAVRGEGINLTAQTRATLTAPTWSDSNNQEATGPFHAVPTLFPSPNVSAADLQIDMEALANGNNVLTSPPPSGVLGDNSNPTQGTVSRRAFASAYQPYFRFVITTTGQIAHGTSGDNSDPAPQGQPAPLTGTTGDLRGEPYGPYLFNVADRSALGLSGGALNVSVQNRRLEWNDNSVGLANSGGPAARINPLPWDDFPVARQNSSRDYPDLPASALTFNLPGALPGAQPNGSNPRLILPQSTQVSVNVPKYQPANLQLAAGNGNAPTPIAPTPSTTLGPVNFPMGYISRQRITGTAGTNIVTTGRGGNQNEGAAFRVVYVYTGVPVDMSTDIQNSVTDIGTVPHGFGIQMNGYIPAGGGGAIGAFTPYNTYAGYRGHFQPLTIHNDGNTNLVNPHLDQKFQLTSGTNQNVQPLSLLSDALDTSSDSPLSTIPAFDFNNVSGNAGFLVRSSLDSDLVPIGINPTFSATDRANYPLGTSTITFHKARVGDTQGSLMTVPDVPHDNVLGATQYYSPVNINGTPALNAAGTAPQYATQPYVSVAVPLGTPVGNYSSNLQLFEGYDPNYSALKGPSYGLVNGNLTDVLSVARYKDPNSNQVVQHGIQTASRPGTQLLVHVNEDRTTDGLTPGALPQIDIPVYNAAALRSVSPINGGSGASDFAPAAFRDPITGSLSLYWASSRYYNPATPTPPYSLFGTNLTFNNGGNTYYTNTSGAPGRFTPNSAQSWWSTPTQITNNTTTTGAGLNVAVDQLPYVTNGTANAYAFLNTITGSGTTSLYTITCAPVAAGTGVVSGGSGVTVAASTQPKSGIHGLTFSGPNFLDAVDGTTNIPNNLWAFWTGGTRGRTALNYSSTTANGGALGTFTTPATLPVPASLVSVADATATLVQAPDLTSPTNGAFANAIEVTYSGVSATGNSDIYVSRFRPYYPRNAQGNQIANAPALLGLMRMPTITEQLQADPRSNWYQARDVGWARNGFLQVSLTENSTTGGTTTVLSNKTYRPNTDGTVSLSDPNVNGGNFSQITNAKVVYDRASGILVLTGVPLPDINGNNVVGQSLFLDLASGRVRFSLPLPATTGTPATTVTTGVTARFNPTARRLTTSPAADTAPTAFLDAALEPALTSGNANVQADRYWVLWHKDAVGKTNPSLWYKTQRLAVAVAKLGQPTNIPANVNVTVNGTPVTADVDAARGRLYFPIVDSSLAMEGQTVQITAGGNPIISTGANNNPIPLEVHWMDEPRYNDTSNQGAPGALETAANDGALVPINTIANESGVTAFLDPAAYANVLGAFDPTVAASASNVQPVPHNVWLFWTSTRSGTADIFYETINPRFAPSTQ